MDFYRTGLFLAVLLFTSTCWGEEAPAGNPEHQQLTPEQLKFFEGKIRPLLSKHCISCHGPDKQSGALRLDLKTSAIEVGGESGPAIVPGDLEESLLIGAIRYEAFEMPPGGQISEEEIALFETWVKQGAFWPHDSPEQSSQVVKQGITEEDRNYWAFQPIRDPKLPVVKDKSWPKQPLDYFVLEKLEQSGLTPSSPARSEDLIRRLYFGVIGLPPTPEVVRQFKSDPSQEAYEKIVDQLLSSQQYGEHMARHWLDLVRYAESDGYRQDAYRPQAWRYRDYVISALNEDMPYDRFLTEQIAGDELSPGDPRALTATGFLRHGVYEYNQRDIRGHWKDIVNEMTDVTSDVFLGLGMGCARCHNHKFDPILQEDYYGLRAYFAPVFWEDFVPLATSEQIEEYQKKLAIWEEKTKHIRDQIDEIEVPLRENLANYQIDRFPEDIQEMIRKPVSERTPEEHQYAELANRFVRSTTERVKTRLKGEERKKWEELQVQLDQFSKFKPEPLPLGPTARDVGKIAPPNEMSSRRGSKDVLPHFLTVLDGRMPEIVPVSGENTTGRRLALARWFTSPEHPLTARVMANRIWQQHFGQGLASSASDFGMLGEAPTHPELLDWLASQLMKGGWSIKAMHRMILLSAAYQQSSQPRDNPDSYAQAVLKDPQNKLIWKMSSHRLNSDQIRDAILFSSKELSLKSGGPSVSADETKRSIYTKLIRNDQHPLFTAFDAPRGTTSTSERNNTTTSTQALLLMNSPWMLKRAEVLADSVLKEIGTFQEDQEKLNQTVKQLYLRTLQREPRHQELVRAVGYIHLSMLQNQADPNLLAMSKLNFAEIPSRTGTAIELKEEPAAPRPRSQHSPLDGHSDFTIEAVVLLKSMYSTANVRTIVSQWNDRQSTSGWSFGVTSEKSRYRPGNLILQLVGKNSGGALQYEVVASNLHLSVNTPYYVAVTVSSQETGETGVKFYVKNLATNDALETSQVPHQVVSHFVDSSTNVVIGGRDTNTPHFWNGLVDDIRISSSRLSEGELLLNQESLTGSTVADWRFEKSPGYLLDASTFAHHLSLAGGAESHTYREPVIDIAHMLMNSNEFLYVD